MFLSRFLIPAVIAVLAAVLAGPASALPPAVGAPATFAAPTGLSGAPSSAVAVGTGDYNGDGPSDIAAVGGGGLTEWPAGGSSHLVAAGASPVRFATADFNRDGRDDVAVTDAGGAVVILRGSANGLTPSGSVTVGGQPYDAAVGDADGDGDADVVTTDLASTSAPVVLLTNNGAGAFTKTPLTSGCTSGAIAAAIGQFVGDGRPDIAVLCFVGEIRFLAPNAAGVFVPSGTHATCGGVGTADLDVADFDRDGASDLVAGCEQGRFSIHLADDDFSSLTGPSGDPWFRVYKGGTGAPLRVLASDFNGDGLQDLVTSTSIPGEHGVGVASGNGSGGFDPAPGTTVGTRAGFDAAVDDVAVGDVDDDGRSDLVAAVATTSPVRVVLNSTPTPSVHTGDATPGPYGGDVGGVLNPHGTATTYKVEYGTTRAYGRRTQSLPTGGSLTGSANQQVSARLSALAPLTTYHYRLIATNARGTTYGRDQTFRTTVVPPASTSDPRIIGTARAGRTLTCAPGSWTGAAGFAFAWLRDGKPVSGAARSAYTARRGDAGHALQCRVTARNAGGTATATSAPVVVRGAQPASCVVPSLRGRTLTRARAALAAAGCRLGKVKRVHASVRRGRIIRSTPRAHRVRPAGARVSVVVSRGPAVP